MTEHESINQIPNKIFYKWDLDCKCSDRERLIFNAGFMACFDGLCKGNSNIDFINYDEIDRV
jgi:hypothetical protein